jgi:hypothetical protein
MIKYHLMTTKQENMCLRTCRFAGQGLALLMIGLSSCSNDKGPSPADCDANPVVISNFVTEKATCGVNDGSIEINADGGNGSYEYSMDGLNFQNEKKFTGLPAGNYNITVRDDNDCDATELIVLESNSGFSIAATTETAGCDNPGGSITITENGGVEPVQFKLNDGAYQSQNSFLNLTSGDYTVTAKDASGCEVISPVKVSAGTSLEDEVMPILVANCAISGCHDGKGSTSNWSNKSSVISNASNIKRRTGNKEMPPGGRTITADEIQTIACWVDDGAINN